MKFTIRELFEVMTGIAVLFSVARLGFNGLLVSFMITNVLLIVCPIAIVITIIVLADRNGQFVDLAKSQIYLLLQKAFFVAVVCTPVVWGTLLAHLWIG